MSSRRSFEHNFAFYGAVVFLFVALVALPGCGGGPVQEATPAPAPSQQLARMLDGMAKTGDSSPLTYMPGLLERMKESGDPKADELLADAKQMQKASGQPERIKELAAKMRAKLPAGKTKPSE